MSHAHAASQHADPGGHQVVEDDPHFGQATDGKIAMWIFLLSDALSFGGLLLGYGILRGGNDAWPDPTKYLGINFTAAMTFLLICSSVTMVLALAGAHDKNKRQLCFFLGLTILGGLLFLSGQAYEYTHLYHDKGMTLSGSNLPVPQFASTFFVITSFHGAHVTTGVIYLSVILFGALRGKYLDNPNSVEIAGLFWHFVDLIWILVFTFVYLIP
jgi:heme/copper-type cytochrome/quinol oxidase subunit 3